MHRFYYLDGFEDSENSLPDPKRILHRDNDLPAVIYDIDKKESEQCLAWYQNGKKHRINGPAVINYHLNSEFWYKEGLPHRNDGPARIWHGPGFKIYFKEGVLCEDRIFKQ